MSARGRGSNTGVGGLVDGRNPRLIDVFAALAPRVVVAEPAAPEDLTWQDKALCAETDPEAFFPEKGGSTRVPKRVCAACEVRKLCLDYALEHDERFGVWGGMSERERRRLKRNPPRVSLEAAITATDASWDAARTAEAEHLREQAQAVSEAYWAAKAAQAPPDPQPREANVA